MTFKLCKFGCGQWLEYSELRARYENVGTGIKHDCPTFHKKARVEPPHKSENQSEPPLTGYNLGDVYLILEEIARLSEHRNQHMARIADAIEYLARK